MGNTIAQSRALQRTDTPAQIATASTVPEARKRGSPLADIRHRDIDAFSDIGTISSGQIAEG